MSWPDRTLRGTKKPQAAWRPAAIFVIQSLSQPQVRARRPKVKIKILAAQGVADLLTVPLHDQTVTNPPAQSIESLMFENPNGLAAIAASDGQAESPRETWYAECA
jgi:hypothetical protein